MPGKSRRGKHPSQSKKKRSKRSVSPIAAQQQPVSPTYKPVSQPKPPAPSPSTLTPMATQAAARYPYIVTELRRIGILAGVMLAVLVVLALVLS